MKYKYILIAYTVSTLLLGVNPAFALDNKAAEQDAAGKAKASHHGVGGYTEYRHKARARIDPVDINNGTSRQLQKLPGVSDVVAKKIIAGRPYTSNSDLLTRNIINKEIYDNIKRRIFIKPGKNSVAKNSEMNNRKK